ncbi:MAG TPA: hypothetical protein VGC87_18490 [Pyrinomonadaceae bacterium]|jgi:hypothetical protein
MNDRLHAAPLLLTLLLVLLCVAPPPARALARDFLTPKEEDLVKEAQVLDKRIEVFIKAAERRLLILTGQQAVPVGKQSEKDAEKWGELPTGTRTELIMDIANILDAAVTNIDDVALRDEKNALIPKALRKLAAAAARFQPQVASLNQQTQVVSEHRALEQVTINIQEILEAAGRLPAEEKKK